MELGQVVPVAISLHIMMQAAAKERNETHVLRLRMKLMDRLETEERKLDRVLAFVRLGRKRI